MPYAAQGAVLIVSISLAILLGVAGVALAQRLIPVFPKVTRLYEDIVKALEAFQARERAREDSREDLLLVVNA